MSEVLQTLPAFLAEPIDSISTQIVVKNLKDSRGRPITAMIGNILYATIEPTSQNNQEIISFTGIVDLGNNLVRLTGVTRNLNPIPPHATLTADVPHGTGATIIITDTPQFWNERAAKDKDENITGDWEFTARPYATVDADATDNRQFVTKGELLRTTFGTITVPGITVSATAGQDITIRQVVWLDETVGTWKLANGDALSEVNGTKKLGITLSTTTSGNTIINGVLISGRVSGYSGLSIGLVYVNDAGNISNTPGTNNRPVGVATSATEILFDESISTRLSVNEKAALAGTNGTPSGANPFVTSTDVVEAATASRIPRRRSTGDVVVPLTPTNPEDAASKSYVDGAETFIMGEAFTGATTPQPAKLINDLIQPWAGTTLDLVPSSFTRVALRVIPRQNCTISSVLFPYFWASAGDSAKTWTATIQTDSGSNPSGTVITNGTSASLPINTITIQRPNYISLNFSTPPSLTANTTYWVVLTLSATVGAQFLIPTAPTAYGSFLGRTWNGSVWASSNLPALELITATGDSRSLWQSQYGGAYQIQSVDGFVVNTGSAGDTATFIPSRTIDGFTGLDIGSDYYLSTTKGAITRNRNQGYFIGTAISATQLRVPAQRLKGDFLINSSVSTVNASGVTSTIFPITFPEDGILTGSFQPSNNGSMSQESSLSFANTFANNTRPSAAGGVGVNKVTVPSTSSGILGRVPFSVPVKKGERMGMDTSNISAALINLRFTPQ